MITLMVVLASLVPQDSKFESSDFGVRLNIPSGWNIDATRQSRVILKLRQQSQTVPAPELLVYEAMMSAPITLGQYREQLRHFLQRGHHQRYPGAHVLHRCASGDDRRICELFGPLRVAV